MVLSLLCLSATILLALLNYNLYDLFQFTSCLSSYKFNELRFHMSDSPAWKSFEVLDSLPLGERSNSIRYLARRRTLTHKHCVRLKKSQDLLRSLQRDCSGGLAPQCSNPNSDSFVRNIVFKVGRPPDQHGEGNTSTARETPLHYVQTGMEGELVGQNEVANVFQRDFMGGPIALNTESGLIMVSRPPDQHGERNTSTACGTPSRNVETGMEVEPVGQNQEANVFRGDFMYGQIALNTDGLTFPECSDAVAPSQPMSTILDTIPHLTGSSSECAFQVKNQSTQFTANPYPNGLVDPHPQIALTQILSETMESLEDSRNLLAPRKEPLPEGHIFGSVNWTVRSCSDVALSQPMPTIPHTTGCSEYWRNSLALLEEHLLEENDYGSINLTAPSCFDPGPSQPVHTIPHTMPTIPQMMPLLTERQDMRSVRLKATYGNTTIKFPLPSGFSELKEEVSKRLEFERGSFKLEYKDEEGDSVLIACDDDVRDYLRLLTSLGNQVIKLFVLDKDIFLPGFPLLNQNSSNSAAFSRASHCFGLGFVSYRLKLVPNLISVMVSMVSE
ncbi:hypothetical protein RHGRI_038676 [Rhododendron griersonianum]|uniref:PB1 domain-containing protein n=1 Tax=Rhododendron griersonianum TaxID=479676 RepID=A0AAV6HMH2_9ERIC|nr:hypothetical protein RHGRI_038676 [Rhododendron griersonianum]